LVAIRVKGITVFKVGSTTKHFNKAR